jgi:hypothetical protein
VRPRFRLFPDVAGLLLVAALEVRLGELLQERPELPDGFGDDRERSSHSTGSDAATVTSAISASTRSAGDEPPALLFGDGPGCPDLGKGCF